MKLVHLSDLHLFLDRPEVALTARDIVARVRALIRDVAAQAPDAVAISGDIACGGSPQVYALAQEMLAPLSCPVMLVPGNHDDRTAFMAAFGGRLRFMEGFAQSVIDAGPLRLIGLDSQIAGASAGALCGRRLDWLAASLAASPEAGIVVVLHHPPFDVANAQWDASNLGEGRAALRDLLRDRDARILCGHVHRPATGWAGRIPAFIAGSPAFQFTLGIEAEYEPEPRALPLRYFIHHRDAAGEWRVFDRFPGLDA